MPNLFELKMRLALDILSPVPASSIIIAVVIARHSALVLRKKLVLFLLMATGVSILERVATIVGILHSIVPYVQTGREALL
jgi:hypothetical protein